MKVEASLKFETTGRKRKETMRASDIREETGVSPVLPIPPEDRAVRALAGRALQDAVSRVFAPEPRPIPKRLGFWARRAAQRAADRKKADTPPAEWFVARARAIATWVKHDVTIGPVLGTTDSRLEIFALSPKRRRYVLKGASRGQLRRMIRWGRDYLNARDQLEAKAGAKRFRDETLTESKELLASVVRDALPRKDGETVKRYVQRTDAFVTTLRGRLTPPQVKL